MDVINVFLTRVLNTPNLFKKYTVKSLIYPVVLGGVDVMRCAKGQGSTSDIDIKFVVCPRVLGPDDVIFQQAISIRDRFIAEVFELGKEALALALGTNSTIELTMGDTDLKILTQRKAIYITYLSTGTKEVIIDTGIFSDYSVEMFDQFHNFFNFASVPTIFVDHIPYATCSWTLVDTVRMLKASKDKGLHIKFWRNKYVKYLSKFALMYNSYNKTDKASAIYQHATKYIQDQDQNDLLLMEKYLEQTNEQNIMDIFTMNRRIDPCYQQIMTFVMDHVLGKYMKRTRDFHPLVIGGIDVNRCLKGRFKITTNDIDIQYIVKENAHGKAAVAKKELVKNITTDQGLLDYLKTMDEFDIRISTFDDWKLGSKQSDMNLVVIVIGFYSLDTLLKSINMIDTIVVPKSMDEPVPYITGSTGIMYATCNFTFHNTVKMIKLYEEKEMTKKDMAKYLRYILKYLALYMVRNKTTKLKSLYRVVLRMIKGLVLKDNVPNVENLVNEVKKATDWL
jgi:hypothetical protein